MEGWERMKTLYLSDLDGTLLGPNAALTPFAEQALAQCIAAGMHVSVATARSYATVKHLLAGVPLQEPIVLMNGVLVYDPAAQRYIRQMNIPPQDVLAICQAAERFGLCGLMYGLKDGAMSTYYEHLDHVPIRNFCQERQRLYGKVFRPVDRFADLGGEDVIYFTWIDTAQRLQPLHDALADMGVGVVLYQDIYDPGLYYLECHSPAASKRSGAEFLRTHGGFDRVVGFGDNLNDIPLFEACDACYAVENAHATLKAMATGILDSHREDGVARYLLALTDKEK